MAAPLRWGVLGAGSIAAAVMAPLLRATPTGELRAVASRSAARAGLLAPARVLGSYDELLRAPDVDAVYIALANDAHHPMALAALRAGKHVLCEKPLALSGGQVDSLGQAAAAAGRLLVEASFWQWHPRAVLLRRLLAEGAIGPLRHVEAGFTFSGVAAGNYRLDPARGGGAGWDVGHYPVSALLTAMAEAPGGAPAAGGVSDLAVHRELGPTGVDLTTAWVVDLAGGATAALRASFVEPARQWLRVTGERGEIELPGPAFTARGGPTVLALSQGRGTDRIELPPADPYALMIEAFTTAARGGQAWVVPLAQSRASVALLAAAASGPARCDAAAPADPT